MDVRELYDIVCGCVADGMQLPGKELQRDLGGPVIGHVEHIGTNNIEGMLSVRHSTMRDETAGWGGDIFGDDKLILLEIGDEKRVQEVRFYSGIMQRIVELGSDIYARSEEEEGTPRRLDDFKELQRVRRDLVNIERGEEQDDGAVVAYDPHEVTIGYELWKMKETLLYVGEDSLPITNTSVAEIIGEEVVVRNEGLKSVVRLRVKPEGENVRVLWRGSQE